MKKLICVMILLGILAPGFAQKEKEQSALESMVATELAFAKMAKDVGTRPAFSAFIADDGILFGPYYEGNEGTAIYNSKFRPFQSPVPFLFIRHGVLSDWKFFLDNEDWLTLWAGRFGESAVHALAAEVRQLPWRARRE